MSKTNDNRHRSKNHQDQQIIKNVPQDKKYNLKRNIPNDKCNNSRINTKIAKSINPIKHTKPIQSTHPVKTKKVASPSYDSDEEITDETESTETVAPINEKVKEHLRLLLKEWMECDEKIKEIRKHTKQYLNAKKDRETRILKIIKDYELDDQRFEVNDSKVTGNVYRYRSETRGALNRDIIHAALMEHVKDKKQADEMLKRIEQKRPVIEKFRLKRTKGQKK